MFLTAFLALLVLTSFLNLLPAFSCFVFVLSGGYRWGGRWHCPTGATGTVQGYSTSTSTDRDSPDDLRPGEDR